MQDCRPNRAAAICAISGSVLLSAGTYLHPMKADPNDAVKAFTEYAADHLWVTSHLMQFAGVTLIIAALLVLAQRLEFTRATNLSLLGAGGAIASLAVTAVLQAIDGIALKAMVDAWMMAPPGQKEIAFRAALAVRQLEVGLASIASALFGCTITVYGVALAVDTSFAKWLGRLAIVGGLLMVFAGVAMAYTGFSSLAMTLNMSAGLVVLLWMVILGVLMWRGTRVIDV